MMRQIPVTDLFSEAELLQALKLKAEDPQHLHARLTTEIVAPVIERINIITHQECSPAYFAYLLEWALTRSAVFN